MTTTTKRTVDLEALACGLSPAMMNRVRYLREIRGEMARMEAVGCRDQRYLDRAKVAADYDAALTARGVTLR